MRSTRLTLRVNAPRATVYRALIDAHAGATGMVPEDMASEGQRMLAEQTCRGQEVVRKTKQGPPQF